MVKKNNIYCVVTDGTDIYIKLQRKIKPNEKVYENTKDLTKEQKEMLLSTLPRLTKYKSYNIISGMVVVRKNYPKNRKKRSIEEYQKKRATKIEDILNRSENGVMTVGDKMRIIRMKNGHTLRSLSEITGVHYLTIHQLENSVVLTKLESFESICLGLNISFEKMQELYTELNLEFYKKRGRKK